MFTRLKRNREGPTRPYRTGGALRRHTLYIGPFARISANNYCLLGMLLATVRGLPHKVWLVKPNFGNLNIGAVGAAIGDDTNGLQTTLALALFAIFCWIF